MMQRQQQGSGYEWLQYGQWEGAKEKFEVKSVNLTENNTIPPDASLLILVRPKALDERQRYEVVKYLAGGGRVLLIAAPFKLTHEFGWRAERTPTGLEDYLKEAGLSFGTGIVADNSNVQMPKSINPFTGEVEMAHFPFYVKVLGENLDHESVLTRFMPALMMPIPAEIDLDDGAACQERHHLAHPGQDFAPKLDRAFHREHKPGQGAASTTRTSRFTPAPRTSLCMLEGQFPFPYEGKPVPEWKAESSDDKDKDKEKEKKDKEKKAPEIAKVEKKPGILVVCSAPEAFHSMYLQPAGTVGAELPGQCRDHREHGRNIQPRRRTWSSCAPRVTKRASIDKLEGKDTKRTITKMALVFAMPVLVMLFALTPHAVAAPHAGAVRAPVRADYRPFELHAVTYVARVTSWRVTSDK